MAEGYLRKFGNELLEVWSAGIETHGVNARAVATMKEDGIDISSHTSNHIEEYRHIKFDFVVTVCDHAQENCPYFSSKAQRFHQNFTDPAKALGTPEEVESAFRKTRNEIKTYCEEFVAKVASA